MTVGVFSLWRILHLSEIPMEITTYWAAFKCHFWIRIFIEWEAGHNENLDPCYVQSIDPYELVCIIMSA